MLVSWLSSVLNLLPFLRCTLIWLDINLLPFSVLSGSSIIGFSVLGLSILAIIFNGTVCILERKAKKRTQALPPAKMSVICLDFFFAACYIAAFVVVLITAADVEWNSSEYYTLHGFTIFGAQTYAGVLVAWHYHLFFAVVSLHSWRRHRNVGEAHRNTETRMDRDEEMVPQVRHSTMTVQTKTAPPPRYEYSLGFSH